MTSTSTAATRKSAKLAEAVAEQRTPTGPASDEPFTFESADGSRITVPSLSVAEGQPNPLALAEARENNDSLAVTLLVVRSKVTPEVFQQLKHLPGDEFADFAAEWAKHSGIDVGKLPVS